MGFMHRNIIGDFRTNAASDLLIESAVREWSFLQEEGVQRLSPSEEVNQRAAQKRLQMGAPLVLLLGSREIFYRGIELGLGIKISDFKIRRKFFSYLFSYFRAIQGLKQTCYAILPFVCLCSPKVVPALSAGLLLLWGFYLDGVRSG